MLRKYLSLCSNSEASKELFSNEWNTFFYDFNLA